MLINCMCSDSIHRPLAPLDLLQTGFTSLVHQRSIPSFGRAAGTGYGWLSDLKNQTEVESVKRYFGKAQLFA